MPTPVPSAGHAGPAGPAPDDAVEVRFTKWDGREHWHVPARVVGSDEHGTWLLTPAATRTWRPGAQFRHRRASVACVPDGGWWVATFYDAETPGRVSVYVDVATPAVWSAGSAVSRTGGEDSTALEALPGGSERLDTSPPVPEPAWVVHTADLDLDVVLPLGGEAFVDDEDEFAEHTQTLGYPADVVEAARGAADALLVAVREAHPPFDGATARAWVTRAGVTWSSPG